MSVSSQREGRRAPRNLDPNQIVHVVSRTQNAKLFMAPSTELNECIGGILARYQEMYGVLIFAYFYASNHMHLLLRCPNSNLDNFMCDVNREIAHRVNRLRNRTGAFWARRYSDQLVVDQKEDGLEALLYIVTNPVRHGLVMEPQSWPGLSCYQQLVQGKAKKYRFFHATKYREAQKVEVGYVRKEDFFTTHTLRLSPLPQFEGMSHSEMIDTLLPQINARTKAIQEERAEEGLGFLGRQAILAQDWNAEPRNVNRSPKPVVYCKDPEQFEQAKKQHKERAAQYRAASEKLRKGIITALKEFPDYCRFPAVYALPAEIAKTVTRVACCKKINLLGKNGNGPMYPSACFSRG